MRKLTLPYIPAGANVLKRQHFMAQARNRRQVHDDVALLTHPEKLYQRAVITLDFRWKDKRRHDLDNAVAGAKAIIDALVGRWIVDDDTEHLSLVVKGVIGTREPDCVVVTCEEQVSALPLVPAVDEMGGALE